MIKFIYSEKATDFCEISTTDLAYVVTVKSTVKISQNFVAFSEYMNFTKKSRKRIRWYNFYSLCGIPNLHRLMFYEVSNFAGEIYDRMEYHNWGPNIFEVAFHTNVTPEVS